MMIVEYLRYRIPTTEGVAFEQAYAKAGEAMVRSPYCLGYELCKCDEEPEVYILRIEWTSAEDHIQRFRGSEVFKEFFSHIRTYLPNIDEMRHYSHVSGTCLRSHKVDTA